MKLTKVTINNFRCYKQQITIDFSDLTAIVGKNDVGKSAIMDALNIFFNDALIEKSDLCVYNAANSNVSIRCEFSNVPDLLILDQTYETNLLQERLLNQNGNLEIEKIYNCALEKPKITSTTIYADHYDSILSKELFKLNNAELKTKARELGINTDLIDLRVNAQIRKLIRSTLSQTSSLSTIPLIEANELNILKGLLTALPAFALFKSDRASTDQDDEAQDPLKAAIKEAIRSKQSELEAITEYIQQEVKKIADLTLEKLKEMDPGLATTLAPSFVKPKWDSIFKASISGDNNIPINKRGSGVRRLILLNFFRAKAQKTLTETNKSSIIMAVEEPETSQHPRNQRLLISALTEISAQDQVIFTTHTPMLARVIPDESIRFIREEDSLRTISNGGSEEVNSLIVEALGILPDHTVKIFIGVEGKTDIPFLKNISRTYRAIDPDLPDLEQLELDGKLIFTPLGGSALALWCNRLARLNIPEFHLYDRDTEPPLDPKYQAIVNQVNLRPRCFACTTNYREIENYIHYAAIERASENIGLSISLNSQLGYFDDVPVIIKDLLNGVSPASNKWGETRVKDFLASVAAREMTPIELQQIDTTNEIRGWLAKINELMISQ